MIKVYQTKFGGSDLPMKEQGDCFQACLASILEIPYDLAFSCVYGDDKPKKGELFEKQPWYIDFLKWLEQFGLASIYLEWKPTAPTVTALLGYHIAECKSSTLRNGDTHAVVIHDGDLVHDPNPKSKVSGDDLLGVYLLVPLDVAGLRKPLPIIYDGGESEVPKV